MYIRWLSSCLHVSEKTFGALKVFKRVNLDGYHLFESVGLLCVASPSSSITVSGWRSGGSNQVKNPHLVGVRRRYDEAYAKWH